MSLVDENSRHSSSESFEESEAEEQHRDEKVEDSMVEDVLDPHIEKNFTSVKEKITEFRSWGDFNTGEETNRKKIFGMSSNEAIAIQGYVPKFKPKLGESWKKSVEAESDDLDDLYLPFQQEILGPLSHYHDISITNVTNESEDETRRIYLLHSINHVLKVRDRILHHNQISALAASNGKSLEDEDIMRDQGFTRPRVLIIAPLRNVAYDLVHMIMELWDPIGTVENKKRFEDEYAEHDEDGDIVRESEPDHTKSDDYNRTFRGNIDDCFRIGLKFTRKSLKLFSDFYNSDIIIASPLGLRLVIDGQKEKGFRGRKSQKRARKADADFLSSINICVIDRADVIHMQNWEHLEYALKHVNGMPVDSHGCDFSRVQTVYLDGFAKNIRQTLTLSQFSFPELNALLNNDDLVDNCLGKWKIASTHQSSILRISRPFIDPKFYRCPTTSLTQQSEDRLEYFVKEVFPLYASESHICIFVSSYFDFCQLKQCFTNNEVHSFTCLSEYEEGGAVTGARAKFFNGHAKFLLITERFHFYRGLKIRGIKHLIWYSLPDHAQFFKEFASMVGDVYKRSEDEDAGKTKRAPKSDSPIIYTQFDALKLERIVGTAMLDRLL